MRKILLVALLASGCASPMAPTTTINSVVAQPFTIPSPVEPSHPWDNGGPKGDMCGGLRTAPDCGRASHPMCSEDVTDGVHVRWSWVCVPEHAFGL